MITYQTGHLKTQQLMFRFLSRGWKVTLFAFPFSPRPRRTDVYPDRPFQLIDFEVEEFCQRSGIAFVRVPGWEDCHADDLERSPLGRPEVLLTVIAKIIPSSFIAGRTILNCHPGLLPENRGVDALKWCVANQWPFGVTLHAIDDAVDRGTILHRARIPILPNDTFRAVCDRMYETEVDVMGDFDRYLPNMGKQWLVGDRYPVSHRRIPRDIDGRIEEIFLEKRSVFVDLASEGP